MEEAINEDSEVKMMEDEEKNNEVKIHKWEHLAIRPETFEEFRALKETLECKSDNEVILKLIKEYKNARE